MAITSIKTRNGIQFELLKTFHCKQDARRELKSFVQQNAFFSYKKAFTFDNQQDSSIGRYAVYVEIVYANPSIKFS